MDLVSHLVPNLKDLDRRAEAVCGDKGRGQEVRQYKGVLRGEGVRQYRGVGEGVRQYKGVGERGQTI